MAKKSRIQPPQKNKRDRISANEGVNHDDLPPIFSLERLQGGRYCFSILSQEDKASFAESIFKRRTLSWQDLKKHNRHGLGFEKLPKRKIRASMPEFITEDKANLLAFRFSGKKPMVGYRIRNIFYVLWFDAAFELYDHGD